MQFHPEQVQSAIDRYANEIKRVLGVLELHLSTTKQPYLVGDTVSYADMMWVPWNSLLPWLLGHDFDFETTYPETFRWNERMTAREGEEDGSCQSRNPRPHRIIQAQIAHCTSKLSDFTGSNRISMLSNTIVSEARRIFTAFPA